MPTLEGIKPTLATERYSCRVDAENGTYSVYNIRSNIFTIEASAMAVMPPAVSNAPPFFLGESLKFNPDRSIWDDNKIQLRYDHPLYPISAVAEFEKDLSDPNALLIRLSFKNSGTRSIQIQCFYPLLVHPGRDASIALGGSWSHALMLMNGETSTCESRVEHFSKPDGTEYESHGYTLFYNELSEQDLLIGFETLHSQCSRIVFSPRTDGMFAHAMCEVNDACVRPGETIRSEALLIRIGEPPKAQLEALARRVHKANELPRLRTPLLNGWSTRGLNGTEKVCESDILRNLAWLATNKQFGLNHVMVHHGWAEKVGDWRDVDPDQFPNGMGDLASRITQAGLIPGLSISPFLAQADSKFFDDHRGWFLKDEDFRLMTARVRSFSTETYILDSSRPEVQEYLTALGQMVARDWGYRLIHIDHLRFAAQPGKFKDISTTRANAFRCGMKAFKDGTGEQVTLIASDAPLSLTSGLADYYRPGPSLQPVWQQGIDGSLRLCGRSSLLRSMSRNQWWHVDLGSINLDLSRLEPNEQHLHDTLHAICGDSRIFQGELCELDDTQLNRMRFLVGQVGFEEAYVPNVVLRNGLPNTYVMQFKTHSLVALFNWDDGEEQIGFPMASIGGEAWDSFLVYNVWESKLVDANAKGQFMACNIHPHSVALLNIVPAPKDDMLALIGSTLHWSQGEREIVKQERVGNKVSMEIYTAPWIGETGALTFYRRGGAITEVEECIGAKATIASSPVTGGLTIMLNLSEITSEKAFLSLSI